MVRKCHSIHRGGGKVSEFPFILRGASSVSLITEVLDVGISPANSHIPVLDMRISPDDRIKYVKDLRG